MNALDHARTYVAASLRELRGAKNRHPDIDAFNRFCRVPVGSPYCAAAISYCFHLAAGDLSAGRGLAFPSSASSQQLMRSLRAMSGYSESATDLLQMRGALFGWTNPGDPAHGHIGFVAHRYHLQGKVVAIGTVEFNTSPATGSRDGDGAYALRRAVPMDRGRKLWFLCTDAFLGGCWWPDPKAATASPH